MSFINTIHTLLSGKLKPVFYGLAAGLYPVFFYYSHNCALVKSSTQIVYFVSVFLLIPIVGFWIASRMFKLSFLKKYDKYILPFLNIWVFLTLIQICLYAGTHLPFILLFGVIALLFSLFFYKYCDKIVVFQFILAAIALFTLIPTIIKQRSFSSEWKKQPDDIAHVIFKKKPNVYFIQPDGYVNPSELKRGYYNVDNSNFENYLTDNDFTLYPNFRSNYASTLPSNSSVFMMKHHYYNKALNDEEGMDARSIIITDNTTLQVFKNNGYKTYFLSEAAYFFLNFPKIGYDYSNFTLEEIPIITKGTDYRRNVFNDFNHILKTDTITPKFFFLQQLKPTHITNSETNSKGVDGEKEAWINRLQIANQRLTQIINSIVENDPEGLIIIMADHGGYVGMTSTRASQEKTQDSDKIISIFSNIFALRGVDSTFTQYNKNLKTSVNVFRVLFSYLSEEKKYLEYLQDDGSYQIIYKGAPRGIYKYIDNDGKTVFERKE